MQQQEEARVAYAEEEARLQQAEAEHRPIVVALDEELTRIKVGGGAQMALDDMSARKSSNSSSSGSSDPLS